ncbi:MAG: hypothetical protein MUF58_06105, partial [Arcicella sp.]|nr:hypothetical protein [Arcicella sp.]
KTQTTYPQLLNLNRKYPINLNRWCLLNFIGVFTQPSIGRPLIEERDFEDHPKLFSMREKIWDGVYAKFFIVPFFNNS